MIEIKIARGKFFTLALAALLCAASSAACLAQSAPQPSGGGPPDVKSILAGPAPILTIDRPQTKYDGALTLTSTAFAANGVIPLRYTSYAESISPALNWSAAPKGTKSFVLMLEDATFGQDRKGNLHWLVFNLPPTTTNLAEGAAMPAGAVVACCVPHDSKDGKTAYVGPHAPSTAAFNYSFQIFALDVVLSLDAKASREAVWDAMNGHVLAKGSLTGAFQGPVTSK